ncbi:hypothetical protein BL864_005379, partial [Escherichia coli]|nr:hypothetical protein [Escherichia coli]
MARKPRSNNKLDNEVAARLEQALESELAADNASPSNGDLEAQISQAADEIVREAGTPEPATPLQPMGFQPANDDRQRHYRAIIQQLNKRGSNAIYWVM